MIGWGALFSWLFHGHWFGVFWAHTIRFSFNTLLLGLDGLFGEACFCVLLCFALVVWFRYGLILPVAEAFHLIKETAVLQCIFNPSELAQ